jgi:uncharacterized protein (TIGR02444 family)
VKTLDPSETISIWDFALAFYQQAGVKADCLAAQDTFGLDVTALIFALYRGENRQGFDAGLAVELARTMSARVVQPLRSARIALKYLPNQVDASDGEALRQRVKTVELEAERLILDALARLPSTGPSRSQEQAVLAIAQASQAGHDPDLLALLKRLALAAQNM